MKILNVLYVYHDGGGYTFAVIEVKRLLRKQPDTICIFKKTFGGDWCDVSTGRRYWHEMQCCLHEEIANYNLHKLHRQLLSLSDPSKRIDHL